MVPRFRYSVPVTDSTAKIDGPGLLRLLGRGVLHPSVLLMLVRAGWRFRGRGWWRRPPFLPLPPANYLAWRLHTAYGDSEAAPDFGELRRYLRWVMRMNRARWQ